MGSAGARLEEAAVGSLSWPPETFSHDLALVMHRAHKVFGSFQFPFDEGFVDDDFRRDVCQFTSLPDLHLVSHRLEVSLHPVDTDRDAIDQ